MTVCPQCGYERTIKDNGFVSVEECPKCGIFYSKWEPSSVSKSTEPALMNRKVSHLKTNTKTNYLFLTFIAILGTSTWAIPKILKFNIAKTNPDSVIIEILMLLALLSPIMTGIIAGFIRPAERIWLWGISGVILCPFYVAFIDRKIDPVSYNMWPIDLILMILIFCPTLALLIMLGALIGRKLRILLTNSRNANRHDAVIISSNKKKMYSPNQVFLGSLLGGPLAGMYFLKCNFVTLLKYEAAKITVVSFILFSIVLGIIFSFVSNTLAKCLLTFLYLIPIVIVNRQYQLSKNSIHESEEYDFHPNDEVLIISIVWIFAFSVIIIVDYLIMRAMGLIS